MNHHAIAIGPDAATAIVRRCLDPALTVTDVRPMHGGSMNRVLEWTTDGRPRQLVAKVNTARSAGAFHREAEMLAIYREAELPVPEVYAEIEPSGDFDGCGLLMQRIPGHNLAEARLTPAGRAAFQHQLARYIAHLHTHRRATYGSAHRPAGPEAWVDAFQPVIAQEYDAVREALSSRTRNIVEDLLAALPPWLDGAGPPTLVHGDLWSTNLLVDDAHPDRPELLAFIDGQASYSDPDYELAYLRLFHTADDRFFRDYHRRHPRREGFERRCRVYWLSTMLMHVRVFGDRYVAACEDMARRVKRMV